jgi:hypothetical protein
MLPPASTDPTRSEPHAGTPLGRPEGDVLGQLAERIELDEWASRSSAGDVPPGLARQARRAVRACSDLTLQLLRVPR